VSEGTNLTLDRLDLGRRSVRVIGKGNKTRDVPIHARAAAALGEWLALRPALITSTTSAAATTLVFIADRGGPLSDRSAPRLVEKAAKQGGLGPHVHPHQLGPRFPTPPPQPWPPQPWPASAGADKERAPKPIMAATARAFMMCQPEKLEQAV